MIDISSETSVKGKVKLIANNLENGIKDLLESDRYKEYLSAMGKFHNYSLNNTILIAMQKPDATYVAGLQKWNKDFHRFVNKGEKGIVILVPTPYNKTVHQKVLDKDGKVLLDNDGNEITEEKTLKIQAFKPAYVYDVSQTHGEPLPSISVNELNGNVDNYKTIFDTIREIAPVEVYFKKIDTGAKGYYDQINKEIVINDGMSELQSLKTLIHETAHAIIHDNDYLKSKGEAKDRFTKEIEAESVAYTVCSYLNLPTDEYSFGYIAGWSGDRQIDAVRDSLEAIKLCSSDIIGELEKRLVPEKAIQLTAEIQQSVKTKSKAV